MVLEHLFIWKASEPKKKPVGNSVKKIPWRKVYTFSLFSSPHESIMSRAKQKRMWTSVIQKRLYKGLKYEKSVILKCEHYSFEGKIDANEKKIL